MPNSPQVLCKQAYSQYLQSGSFIEVAVQAACEAIELGCTNAGTYRLAGADDDEPNDVIRMLKELAQRQFVELPNQHSEALWLLRVYDELESCGLTYDVLSTTEQFYRHVDEIGLALAAWSAHHEEMNVAEFAIHLRKHSEDWNVWSARLDRKQAPAECTLKGTPGEGVCAGLSALLIGTAFGGITEENLEASTELVEASRVLWDQFLT